MDLDFINRSVASPLVIDSVVVPSTGGVIGMTVCPGKNEYASLGFLTGPWQRDLDLDLQVIRDWQTQALVSLIEDFEFNLLGVTDLGEKTRALNILWYHLPIADLSIPDRSFEEKWLTTGQELRQVLTEGGRIVLHCRGGLGRTGIIAARLLIEFGVKPEDAIRMVRRARPGTIQTSEQEEYALNFEYIKKTGPPW